MSSDEVHEPRHWKVKKQDGSRLEPANLDVLRQWVASRQISPDDLVINDDLADWIRASEVIELFDLFEKREGKHEPPPPPAAEPEPKPIEIQEAEVEVPDCAYHPGRKATEICVGCGKFICEECRERLEGKMYCRRCRAEKQAGVEPGAPVGPGAPARIISGVPPPSTTSRLALASFVFAVVALLASGMMVVPRFILTTAPAVAFIAFVAAMLGGLAFNRIRLSGGALRGGPFALAGLISGCFILVASLTVAFVFTGRLQRASEGDTGLTQTVPGRRQGPARRQPLPQLTRQAQEEREANAKQLLEQVEKYLNEGQLDQAVSTSRTILGLYPDTETAKLIDERLPALEQALARRQAEEEEIRQQNEQLSQQRFEHALTMYSDGNRATALDLLKSIVENYPETNAAELARVEIAKIEKAIADQEMKRLNEEASQLAGQAEQRMEAEQYAEAVELYREIMSRYPQTPTATTIRPKLKEAELLASDPSERDFRKIQKELQTSTYEESVALLQDFLAKYADSDRAAEAEELLDENQASKRTADSLYNFGRTYFEEQKYNVALGRYGKLINEYPRSRWIPQAKKEYEETLEKLRE